MNVNLVIMLFFRCLNAVCCTQQLYLMTINIPLPFHISAPLCIAHVHIVHPFRPLYVIIILKKPFFLSVELYVYVCLVHHDAPHSFSVPPTSSSSSYLLLRLTSCCCSHLQTPEALQKLLMPMPHLPILMDTFYELLL